MDDLGPIFCGFKIKQTENELQNRVACYSNGTRLNKYYIPIAYIIIYVSWGVKPCRLVSNYGRFEVA